MVDAGLTWVAGRGSGLLEDLLPDGVADLPAASVAAVLAVLVLVLVLLRLARRRPRPSPGEIWFADVPFEDGTGSKDRPVLVVAVRGRRLTVARFTSQDKSARRDHLRIPDGVPGLARASWVDTRTVLLRRSALRRRSGSPGPALVEWYQRATARGPGR